MKNIFIKTLLILPLLVLTSCNNDDANGTDGLKYSEQLNLAYGADVHQKMDIYLPKNRTSQTTLLVAVHGGGFFTGKKEDINVPVFKLVDMGYAVLNINYRLVDTTGVFQDPIIHQPSTITITQQLEDIQSAIHFSKKKYKQWTVSPDQWGLFGHSAGATLALLYTHGGSNSDGQIKAVGNLAGALDFSFVDASEFDVLEPKIKEFLYRAIGAEPSNNNKLAYMAKSPFWVTFNKTNPEPTINILPENNDTGGNTIDGEDKYMAYKNLLDTKQVPNKFIVVEGADHGFNQPGNWEEAVEQLSDFFANEIR